MMLTREQAKVGKHRHITPLTSELNYHTLEEMWILIFVIVCDLNVKQ